MQKVVRSKGPKKERKKNWNGQSQKKVQVLASAPALNCAFLYLWENLSFGELFILPFQQN